MVIHHAQAILATFIYILSFCLLSSLLFPCLSFLFSLFSALSLPAVFWLKFVMHPVTNTLLIQSFSAEPRWKHCDLKPNIQYFLGSTETSWVKSEAICNEYGGTLAIPKTERENTCIHRLTNGIQGDAWLGITGELVGVKVSQFRYSDGRLVNPIFNWTTSHPAHIAPHTCVKISSDKSDFNARWRVNSGRGWTDSFCSDFARPVCQKTKLHVIFPESESTKGIWNV